MLTFEELIDARRALQSFCLLHVPSLLALHSGASFKLLPSEASLDDGKVHHLSTTATCLSSLLDAPPRFRSGDFSAIETLYSNFGSSALDRQDWVSEGSASVYCRCRALPTVISSLKHFDKRIEDHVSEILGQLEQRPDRFGIGEAGAALPEVEWYPANAFHTFWTLEIFDQIRNKFEVEYTRLSAPRGLDLTSKRVGMLLWGRHQLGIQLGLHSSAPPSSMLDSDQLAWSLAIFLRFDKTLNVNLENRDFIKQAFKCLFSTQTDGTWRHYKPLFHYRKAGNAYCYVFETFAVLVQCALQERPEAEMLRELLKPYSQNLIDLWRYAESTKIPLAQDAKEIGWCSGHRTNVTEPESWATASVFSYAQALRRLIGIWCREEAYSSLSAPRSRLSRVQAAAEMDSRGKTWGMNRAPVSEMLWTMFINPVRMHECNDRLEPDSQPIEKHHARSTILFGPPGTSKTTLVRSLADIIEWSYVELHASHFVAEGLTQVQKTADRIFKRLSELDHAVVLFDEIDELVRERDMEKDAFGRFLTTSMLPKLAELWEARKILYFVATNHINYFDSAIIRSHRFDALILVSPPSFRVKVEELSRLLTKNYGFKDITFQITEEDVEKELQNVVTSASTNALNEAQDNAVDVSTWLEQKLNPALALAKLVLLRWDELQELAYRLANKLREQSSPTKGAVISSGILRAALAAIADSEWRKNKSYSDYLRDTRSQRRDFQMLNVWQVNTSVKNAIPGVIARNGALWLSQAVDSAKDIRLTNFELNSKERGCLEIGKSGSKEEKKPASGKNIKTASEKKKKTEPQKKTK